MIGYRSIVDSGVRWRDNQGGFFLLSPPNKLTCFESNSAISLLKYTGELFVRWETDFDKIACSDWWHVIRDGAFSLECLSGSTRSKVRRGLKNFKCVPIRRESVLRFGYEVYRKAFKRYQTHERQYSLAEFSEAIRFLPQETEFWGVVSKTTNELVAFSENYVESQTCFYNTIWFEPSALRQYSAYALFFEMTSHYLMDRKFKYVSNGARSLSHQTQIHDFLESKFHYRKAYARLHVSHTPILSIAVTLAYPFRHQLKKVPLPSIKKVSTLLKQEEICRSCNRLKI